MDVRLAHRQDFDAIVSLLNEYGKFTITPRHINHRDISIIAYSPEGQCIGFLWAGLMAGNTVAYIDKFCVKKEFNGNRLGKRMAIRAMQEGVKRGVREVFGIIRQDDYHDKSAMNALKSAIGADTLPYTFVRADLNYMVSEMKTLTQGE